MAKKRMFSSAIVTSDAFLDLPPTAQNLYFHIGMRADDEGFLNDVRAIARTVQATPSDIDALVNTRFLLAFEGGVYCIKHWRMNNTLRAERVAPTQYSEFRAKLTVKDNGAYTMADKCPSNGSQVADKCLSSGSQVADKCLPSDSQVADKCLSSDRQVADKCLSSDGIDKIRLDKIRLDKIRLDKNISSSDTSSIISTLSSTSTGADTNDADRDSVPQSTENPSAKTPQSVSSEDVSEIRKPSRADVEAYIVSHDYKVDADAFCDKYDALGWTLRGEPIQDWRAVVRAWHANAGRKKKAGYAEHEYTDEYFKAREIAAKNKMFEGRKKNV